MTTYTLTYNGTWSNPNIWYNDDTMMLGDGTPGANDTAIVDNQNASRLTGAGSAMVLDVSGASLLGQALTLTVDQITFGATTGITLDSASTLTVNGTLDFSGGGYIAGTGALVTTGGASGPGSIQVSSWSAAGNVTGLGGISVQGNFSAGNVSANGVDLGGGTDTLGSVSANGLGVGAAAATTGAVSVDAQGNGALIVSHAGSLSAPSITDAGATTTTLGIPLEAINAGSSISTTTATGFSAIEAFQGASIQITDSVATDAVLVQEVFPNAGPPGPTSIVIDGDLTLGSLPNSQFIPTTSQVEFGGTLSVGGTITVGDNATISAALDVDGGNQDPTDTTGKPGQATADALILGALGGGDVVTISLGGSVGITHGITIGKVAATKADVLTVTDQGSTLTAGGPVVVGDAGDGTLTATNGGSVSVTGSVDSMIDAGKAQGAIGTLSITAVTAGGAGMVVNGAVTLGDAGQGNLSILNFFGQGSSLDLRITGDLTEGSAATGTGTDTIGSVNTTVTIGGDWVIGAAGSHQDTIRQGATVNFAGDLTLGQAATGNGSLTITDAGTTVTATATGDATVGDAGTGSLTVQNAASLDDSLDGLTLGAQAASQGTLLVTDAGTMMDVGDLTIGDAGTGTLTVQSGADLAVGGDLTLGGQMGGKGTATITDAGTSFDITGDATIGDGGSGTVVVDGAAATISGSTATLGAQSSGAGTLTVEVSTLDVKGELVVGDQGKGTAIVQLGGTLSADAITVGKTLGASGSLSLSGAGTRATSHDLTIGSAGQGSLSVTSSAKLTTTGDATIGDLVLAHTQTASLDTKGLWDILTDLTVGGSGLAALTVKGAAAVAADGNVVLGDQHGAEGSATVSGTVTVSGKVTPSSLGWGDTLTVGSDGQGMLTVQGGGLVAPIPSGKGDIEIGAKSDGAGTLAVTGAGSTLDASNLAVGGTATSSGGKGTLSIASGGLVDVTDVEVWGGGHVVLSGGKLQTDPVTISGGDISGNGTVTGDVDDGGTITASGGLLTLTGNLDGAGQVLIGAAADLSLYGSVAASLNLSFDGANAVLDIKDPAGFAPIINDYATGDQVQVYGIAGLGDPDYTHASGDTTVTWGDSISLTFAGIYAAGSIDFVADTSPPCFAAGTRIATARGDVAVEHLRKDDRACLATGGSRPIGWIGRRSVDPRRHPKPKTVLPVCVSRDAFGPGLPHRDLFLSPDHAVFVEDVLIPVQYLVNGTSVRQLSECGPITYFHVELDRHDVLLAEGLPVETYLETGNRAAFENGGATISLHPDFVMLTWEAKGCAPLVVTGPALAKARARLGRTFPSFLANRLTGSEGE
jgi:T5SS/PEP-CTERM-associated repeat protein